MKPPRHETASRAWGKVREGAEVVVNGFTAAICPPPSHRAESPPPGSNISPPSLAVDRALSACGEYPLNPTLELAHVSTPANAAPASARRQAATSSRDSAREASANRSPRAPRGPRST